MSDVNLDSQFNWSPIRTGMEEMRAFVGQTTRGIGRDVSGMFAAGIAVTSVIGAIHSIVEEAQQIHKTAALFRIDAQELQTIGGAAREINIPLETVARSMNLLELNAYKATQADNEQRKALQALGIEADKFFKLNAAEKVLALSDAYVAAADKGKAYAEVAQLIGSRNTDLIRLLAQGSEAIREQGNSLKYTTEQLEQLDRAKSTLERLGHDAKVVGAEIIVGLVTPILNGVDKINKAFVDMGAGIKRLASDDVHGGFQQFFIGSGTTPVKPPAPVTPEAREGAAAEEAGAAATGGGSGSVAGRTKAAEKLIDLAEKLGKVERDNGFARLSDGGKLEALQRELIALREKAISLEGGTTEQLEAQIAIAEKQGAIDQLSAKMDKEQLDTEAKIAKLREEMAAQADLDLADAQQRNKELTLEILGRKDLADRSRTEYEFDQKIQQAREAVTDAEEQGFEAVANTNRALVTQLSLEKQTALAAHDKARAEEMAAAAAKAKAAVESEKQNLADLQAQNAEVSLRLAGLETEAELLRNNHSYNVQINQALVDANDLWAQMDAAYAEGNVALGDQLATHAQIKQAEADQLGILKQQTAEQILQNKALQDRADAEEASLNQRGGRVGVDQFGRPVAANDISIASMASMGLSMGFGPETFGSDEQYQRYMARVQLQNLTGVNTIGFIERANMQARQDAWAKEQNRIALEQAEATRRQQIAYWQAIAGGHAPMPDNPFTNMYGTSPYMPQQTGTGNDATIQQLQQQINLLQSQLTSLQSIDKKLTPVPGGPFS